MRYFLPSERLTGLQHSTSACMKESEWRRRKTRIDAMLGSLSPAWHIVRYHDGLNLSALACHDVEELPTANGPADYGLVVNGRLLGIIGAMKVTVNRMQPRSQSNLAKTGEKPSNAKSIPNLLV